MHVKPQFDEKKNTPLFSLIGQLGEVCLRIHLSAHASLWRSIKQLMQLLGSKLWLKDIFRTGGAK